MRLLTRGLVTATLLTLPVMAVQAQIINGAATGIASPSATITFSGASFNFATNTGLPASNLAAFLGATEVAAFSTTIPSVGTNTGDPNLFYGFDGILFDRIVVTPGSNQYAQIDNVSFQLSAVPEPSTYLLMGAGLAGVFGMVRRRRA